MPFPFNIGFEGPEILGQTAALGQRREESFMAQRERMLEREEKRREESKRVLQAGKASEALFKALEPDQRRELGLPDEHTFMLGGSMEKTAAIAGALQAQGARKALLEQQKLTRLPAFLDALSQRGMRPEEVPSPLSNEAFDELTRPVDLPFIAGAASKTGFPLDLQDASGLLRAIAAAQPEAPRGLPLGQVLEIPGRGYMVGTGEHFESNFVPFPRTETPARDYPWLYAPHEEFILGLQTVKEPAERDRVLKTRYEIERVNPKLSLLEALMRGFDPEGETPSGGGKVTPAKPRLRYDPATRSILEIK